MKIVQILSSLAAAAAIAFSAGTSDHAFAQQTADQQEEASANQNAVQGAQGRGRGSLSQNAATTATQGRRGGRGGRGNGNTLAVATAAAAAGAKIPDGPYQPNWDSFKENYKTPEWVRDAKFGITMHWGLYSVPAHGSEWYVKHMYNPTGLMQWHVEHWGPLDKFGYKDFIPMFTAAKFDPEAWAALFKKAGAKYVTMTAEHHDGFALWDSALTKWDAKDMGPRRDLVGDLNKAVKAQGLKFGVTNHRMEHYSFIAPPQGIKSDLDDPAYDDFYWTQNHSDKRYQEFLEDWVARNIELIDKYQPDVLWYDNGVNGRDLDPVKLKVAAYFYNQAAKLGKEVTMSTKGQAYLYGSFEDYERQGRGPQEITDYAWEVDDSVHQRWGYLSDANYPPDAEWIVYRVVENASRNGSLLCNFSPKPDGTFPEEQIKLMEGIGQWLAINGDGIYGTRPWIKFGEGPAMAREQRPNQPPYTAEDIRFMHKGDDFYAWLMAWPADGKIAIKSLATGAEGFSGKVSGVSLLGHDGALPFKQDADGLHVTLPAEKPGDFAYGLKISGLQIK